MKAADDAVSRADADLIEWVLGGDRACFSILYERYFARVYGFVDRRVSNRADAEEIVQEAFANIFCCLDSFRAEAPFAAWVFGVTRRTLANRFKKKRRETLCFEEEDASSMLANAIQREPTPLEHYECRERIGLLERAAADDLSPIQQRLFEMHHLQHRSVQEIARATNKTEDSVKSYLYRARRTLLAR